MNQKIIIAVIIIVGTIAGVYAYAQANNLTISPPPIVQMVIPTVSKPIAPFYTMTGSATSDYNPTTKILTVTVISPGNNSNYTVILTDNNNNYLINKTFFPNGKESSTMTFNTAGTAKPLHLVVKYNNAIVYTAYHGSPFEP